MEENEILRKVPDAVTGEAVAFDVDILPKSTLHGWLQQRKLKPTKRYFEIRPLTLGTLQRISKLLIEVQIQNLTPDDLLRLMGEHTTTMAHIIALAVTNTKQPPRKELIEFFIYNLSKEDLSVVLSIVLKQMDVLSFTKSIISIRSLNILEMSRQTPVETIAPGALSAVS